MSAASDPRNTGYWQDAFIAARTVIEDSGLLPQTDADQLAEAVTERMLGDFLAIAEESSEIVSGPDGTGPYCSWCGRMPGPRLPKGHFQYGIFCDCKRPEGRANNEEKAA